MKTSNRMPGTAILAGALAVCGCAADGGPNVMHAHDGMDAILWVQTSTEYAATTTGIYSAAAAELERIAAGNPDGVRGMAIVLDVDETVLDNSPYQGQMVLDDTSYESESWDRWIALRDAGAVPGSVEFIGEARSLGAEIAFVTNRACRARPNTADPCPQKLDTLVNLRQLGIEAEAESLFLRGDAPPSRCRELLSESERDGGQWSSDKTSRRECVGADHDIVMLFGDQLGDFTEEAPHTAPRSGPDVASDYARYWGRRWFMLPNPTYGDWQPQDAEAKWPAIRGVD